MKTLFITSFFGFIARNILATDFLKIVRQDPNLRIVILVPENKKERHEKEFGGGNVIVEGIKLETPSFLDRIFTVVFHNLSDTSTWRIHRFINIKRDKKYFSAPFYWLLSKIGYSKPIRVAARWLENHLLAKNRFGELFEKYQPGLVFVTDVFEPNDVDLMREAKRRGIFLIGMVRSWDNITSKGLNRIIPDRVVVNTESLKGEAVKYNDVKSENISIVGIPHYDYYVTEKRISRDELFKSLDLNPKKKLIFFAPPADLYAGNDPITLKVMEALYQIDAQIVVRMPLVGEVNLGNFRKEPGKIAVDLPGSAKDFVNADISRAGDKHLADLIYWSDVVVAFASTLAIDAVAFDKPVVFVGFDGEPRPYWDSLVRYYDYDHQRALLDTGGVKLARTPADLVNFTSEYLKDPHLDEIERRKIIDDRCWKLDGHSGERLAEVIMRVITK